MRLTILCGIMVFCLFFILFMPSKPAQALPVPERVNFHTSFIITGTLGTGTVMYRFPIINFKLLLHHRHQQETWIFIFKYLLQTVSVMNLISSMSIHPKILIYTI